MNALALKSPEKETLASSGQTLNGTITYSGEEPHAQPSVDTLVAGDIFHGTFCHYIL
ncbi:hypothetical protein [Scytonema sp. NUACC26]|uniref:hypothetical protein n=1 Tax=Scytonema sp. NUACC26 TaxID=3140176 RepID=UPI0038B36B31